MIRTNVQNRNEDLGEAQSRLYYWVYVLESQKDHDRYIGYARNLKKRIEEHNKGRNFSTKFRRPFKLIYFEACLNEVDAKRREHYLKTTQGRRFLGLRLKEYGYESKAAFCPGG